MPRWITNNPPIPTVASAGGVWSLSEQFVYRKAGIWPDAAIRGEQVYTTPGTYSWTVPAGVSYVSVLCIGGGGGSYRNSTGAVGGTSSFNGVVLEAYGGNGGTQDPATILGGTGTSIGGRIGGGNGGQPTTAGGGAGGYSGKGGNGGGNAGSGGGGGGGGAPDAGGAGGGVGIYGQGSSGTGGDNGTGSGGGGGSGGAAGGDVNNSTGARGGSYGGGGGCWVYSTAYGGSGGGLRYYNTYAVTAGQSIAVIVGAGGDGGSSGAGSGANGAVRIVWPGNARVFPSTDVAIT